MIRLTAVPCPIELTEDIRQTLTAKYKATKESVWKQAYIKRELLTISHEKCCYCECKLEVESNYMEVEHFHDKHTYPDEVVAWDNLLPACKRCNLAKGRHDTYTNPIINPIWDDPKEHLVFKLYRLIGKSDLGKETIEAVNLNDAAKLVKIRFEYGNGILKELEEAHQYSIDYLKANNKTTQRKNRLRNNLKAILQKGTPPSTYSATIATVILNDAFFQEVKRIFITLDWWDEVFIELEAEMTFCALEMR